MTYTTYNIYDRILSLACSTGELRGCRGVTEDCHLFVVLCASVRIKVSFRRFLPLTPLFVLFYLTRVLLRSRLHLDPHSLLLLAKVKPTAIWDTTIDSHPLIGYYVLHPCPWCDSENSTRIMIGENAAYRFLGCLSIISEMRWTNGGNGSDVWMGRKSCEGSLRKHCRGGPVKGRAATMLAQPGWMLKQTAVQWTYKERKFKN